MRRPFFTLIGCMNYSPESELLSLFDLFSNKISERPRQKIIWNGHSNKNGGGGDWRIAHHIWVEKQKIGHTFVLCFLKSLLIWVSYCLQRVIVSRFSRAVTVEKKERKNERKWFTTDVITVVTPMASNEWRRRRVFFFLFSSARRITAPLAFSIFSLLCLFVTWFNIKLNIVLKWGWSAGGIGRLSVNPSERFSQTFWLEELTESCREDFRFPWRIKKEILGRFRDFCRHGLRARSKRKVWTGRKRERREGKCDQCTAGRRTF